MSDYHVGPGTRTAPSVIHAGLFELRSVLHSFVQANDDATLRQIIIYGDDMDGSGLSPRRRRRDQRRRAGAHRLLLLSANTLRRV